MRLGWDWFKFLFDAIVDYLCCVDNFSCATLYLVTEHSKVLVHDLTEDHFDTVSIKLVVSDNVIVALQTLSQYTSATTWWAHRRDEDNVLDLHVLLSKSIVPAFVVHPLTEQLERWLSTILLFLWHVEVINEDDVLFTKSRTVTILSPLFEV
jgi:hypothetical protein